MSGLVLRLKLSSLRKCMLLLSLQLTHLLASLGQQRSHVHCMRFGRLALLLALAVYTLLLFRLMCVGLQHPLGYFSIERQTPI
jgi:hypothetical protein